MLKVVIEKPYVPVPPMRRAAFWTRLLTPVLPLYLRKTAGLTKIEYRNAERLRASFEAGHGVLITANHCRDEDPMIIGLLYPGNHRPFAMMASWHLFNQSRFMRFLLPRLGAFSVYREGVDRAAIKTAVTILEKARQPLVIFPEGYVARTNDRLNRLLEGASSIARVAARRRAKQTPPGKVVVHPVALRYHFEGDVESSVAGVLEDFETRLTWQLSRGVPAVQRILKISAAVLALKEIEYLGQPQTGPAADRLKRLIDSILNPLEDEWVQGKHDDTVHERVRRLRTAILPGLVEGKLDEKAHAKRWKQLADIYLAQQLDNYPHDYLSGTPSADRIIETVQRLEEDLEDKVRIHGPVTAVVTIGEAIEVNPTEEFTGEDPLLTEISKRLREMLGIG